MIRPVHALLAVLLLAAPAQAAPAAAPAARAAPFVSPRIVVEARGRGPDVILIPGLASTPAVWAETADRLAARHRVHLVAVRGFGDLAAGANAAGAVTGPVAGEIRRYIAERGLSHPAVIGHSMGGLVALRLAADAGPAVGRVMVVDASPFFPSLISPGATVGDVEPLAALAYQAVNLFGDNALQGQGAALGRQFGGGAGSLFSGLGWQGGDRRTLAQGLYEVMTTDLRARLGAITASVTVVYGWSPDDASPRAALETLFRAGFRNLRRPPRFEPIADADHMVMIDQPNRFAAAVERFLD